MALPRSEGVPGFLRELERFEDLIRPLDDARWRTATRCEGWTIGNIAAHVVGGLAEVLAGRAGQVGEPDTQQRIQDERRDRSAGEVADELAELRKAARALGETFDDEAWNRPVEGVPTTIAPTLGDGLEALWYDAYVHIEDIRAALGMPPARGEGLRASVSHLAVLLEQQGWGPGVLALEGIEEFPVGGANGRRVEGDPLDFVLVATGRSDPSRLGLDESVNVYRAQ